MNIYDMYKENGNKVGFWIQRDTWGNHIAQVVSIDLNLDGSLPGVSPYHNNTFVLVDIYDLRTGKLSENWNGGAKQFLLSTPGSYGYKKASQILSESEPPTE